MTKWLDDIHDAALAWQEQDTGSGGLEEETAGEWSVWLFKLLRVARAAEDFLKIHDKAREAFERGEPDDTLKRPLEMAVESIRAALQDDPEVG